MVLWNTIKKKEGTFLLKSNEPIAHVSEEERVHSLLEHLEGTAKLADNFIEAKSIRKRRNSNGNES